MCARGELRVHRYTRVRMRDVGEGPKAFLYCYNISSLPDPILIQPRPTPVQNQNIVVRGCAFQKALERIAHDITGLMSESLDIDVANFSLHIRSCVFLKILIQWHTDPSPAVPKHDPMHIKPVIY